MALEKTWRWFGRKDSVRLADLKQMGVEGVVTSLHHIPAGEVWPVEEILAVKQEIENHGMRWSVVESLPVSEGIKICSADRSRLIENYRQSLRNLGACGIDTVCYNFMPVLDWARTDLHYKNADGAESMLFDYPTFAAFDIYILKREGDYLKTYDRIGKEQLRHNLVLFLDDVVSVAEEAGVNLCIHPDDPPFPLLGLPRIAGTVEDIRWILSQCESVANGITFCTGSLSARPDNDLVLMAKEFASRIHFVHLRNTAFLPDHGFYESGHLGGSVDMFAVVKVLLEEQIRRKKVGRKDIRLPFRPDHGLRMLDDYGRRANPGYPLIGRLKGLAEIDGLQTGIERFLIENPDKIN